MDNRVLTYMLLNSGSILTVVTFVFAVTQRAPRGEWHWFGSNASLTLALALFLLGPQRLPVVSVLAANLLYTASIVLLDTGLRTFRSRPLPMLLYAAVIISELLLLALFTFVLPGRSARVVVVSLYSAGLYLMVSVNLLRRFPEMPKTVPLLLGLVFMIASGFFAYRAVTELFRLGHDLLGAQAPLTATLIVYNFGSSVWIGGMIGFIILKNQLLHERLERFADRLGILRDVYRRILELVPVGKIASFALASLDGLIETRGSEAIVVPAGDKSARLLATTLPADESSAGKAADLGLWWWERAREGLAGGKDFFVEEAGDLAEGLVRGRIPGRVGSLLVAGITAEGALIGVLWAVAPDRRRFTEEQTQAAVEFANAISLAVHTAFARESLTLHAGRLERSLAEKELLLREVNHRVKNNLQVISSLLYLQSTGTKDPELLRVFKELQDRVRSIVLVHDRLFSGAVVGELRFDEYVRSLAGHLMLSNGIGPDRVQCSVMDSKLLLPPDFAVPLGLIINEIISNSLRHAFPDGDKGTISIDCREEESGFFLLTVRSEGAGRSERAESSSRIGFRIVEALCRQIGATLWVDSATGTSYSIRIPHPAGKE